MYRSRYRNRNYQAVKAHYSPKFRDYDLLRDAWLAHNPQHTPEQYRAAMQKISRDCGIVIERGL